jgi:predicted esterase
MTETTLDAVQAEFWQLYADKAYTDALALVVRNEGLFDSRPQFYNWKMCMAARSGDLPLALATFQQAVDEGIWYRRADLRDDEDLAGLQGRPEFERLVELCEERYTTAAAQATPELLVIEPAGAPPFELLLALHGNNSSAAASARFWHAAAQPGRLLALARSSQVAGYDAFIWNNYQRAVPEIQQHVGALATQYPIDRERVVVGGFSAGGGLALWLALSGAVRARGFVSFAPWLPETASLDTLLSTYDGRDLRGYVVVGEQDELCLPLARQVEAQLRARSIPIELVVVPGLAHTYPADVDRHLGRALRYVLD